MSLEDWLADMRTMVGRIELSLDEAKRAAAGTVTTAESPCGTVTATVDSSGKLLELAIEPGSFADHDVDSFGDAVVRAHNLAKRQWPMERRDRFRDAYFKER